MGKVVKQSQSKYCVYSSKGDLVKCYGTAKEAIALQYQREHGKTGEWPKKVELEGFSGQKKSKKK